MIPPPNSMPAASPQGIVHPHVVDGLPAIELLALLFGYGREPSSPITGDCRAVLGGHSDEGIREAREGCPFQKQADQPFAHAAGPVVGIYYDAGELDFLFCLVDPQLTVAYRCLPVAQYVGFHVGFCVPAPEHRSVDGPSAGAARPQAYLFGGSGPARDLSRVR